MGDDEIPPWVEELRKRLGACKIAVIWANELDDKGKEIVHWCGSVGGDDDIEGLIPTIIYALEGIQSEVLAIQNSEELEDDD